MTASRTLHIAADHPAFEGHFPGRPILPGALLLDEVLRIIEIERSLDLADWQLVSAKFQGALRPGEIPQVEYSSPTDQTIRFAVRADGRALLTGTLSRLPAARNES